MGEGNRVKQFGLGARQIRPGDQIQIDIRNSVPKKCTCGSKLFQQAVVVHVVSALMSPTGQELLVQQPVLVCLDCKKILGGEAGNGEKTN